MRVHTAWCWSFSRLRTTGKFVTTVRRRKQVVPPQLKKKHLQTTACMLISRSSANQYHDVRALRAVHARCFRLARRQASEEALLLIANDKMKQEVF